LLDLLDRDGGAIKLDSLLGLGPQVGDKEVGGFQRFHGVELILVEDDPFPGGDRDPELPLQRLDPSLQELHTGWVRGLVRRYVSILGESHQHDLAVVLDIDEGEHGAILLGHGKGFLEAVDGHELS
jgi:hypothetical protein